jgi:hypothetical protein
MMAADLDRQGLVKEIEALSKEIAGGFGDAIPPLAHVQLPPGVRCPEPGDIPVAALRRLYAALAGFMAEAGGA